MRSIPDNYIIETKDYILRPPNQTDIPFIFSASRYAGFTDGMLWEPPERESDLYENLKKSLVAWKSGQGFSFTIINKQSKAFLGRISIRKTGEENVWNVGFWTHPEQQKKGVMTKVLASILDFGFRELQANKIEACHALWNVGSEKVLKRNGMKFERFLAKGYKKKGEWVAENLLTITREVWLKTLL